MTTTNTKQCAHWEEVYATKSADEVSWFQTRPDLSLKLVRRLGLERDAGVIDIGGGASTLVDHLLADGFVDVSVLDVAAAALDQTKRRLGPDAARVAWISADITQWRPPRTFALWHDRAVLHFLTDPRDQRAYREVLRAAVPMDGWVIIGGFAPGGPTKCSGLDIIQHDAASLGALLGRSFALLETHGEIHITPSGREQAFRYHLLVRASS